MIGLINFSNPTFNYRYKGYTAIINQVVDITIEHYKLYKNFDLNIQDEQIKTHFDLIKNLGFYDYNASDLFLEKFFKNETTHNFYNAHTIANKENLNLRKFIFENILIPKKEITEGVDKIKDEIFKDKNILGIQIRGTDKINEIPKIPDDVILKQIETYFNKNKIDKIFLCTDDFNYINLLINNFGDLVEYNKNNLISYNGDPIHFSNNKEIINKEVLIDVYLLSNCHYFLYCFSNVSFLALTLGVDKIIDFKNINNEN
jgi:hypothetical protein